MKFTAGTATYDVIESAHVVGLASGDGEDGYLVFLRCDESDPDDWGIHFEVNDQNNSGYEIIRKCMINRTTVAIELMPDIAIPNIIEVSLAISDRSFDAFLRGMKEVFRGKLDKLEIDA